MLHTADYILLKAAKEIIPRLPDNLVPRYVKAFVERLEIEEPPPDYSPEVIVNMLKAVGEKKKQTGKRKGFPFLPF